MSVKQLERVECVIGVAVELETKDLTRWKHVQNEEGRTKHRT